MQTDFRNVHTVDLHPPSTSRRAMEENKTEKQMGRKTKEELATSDSANSFSSKKVIRGSIVTRAHDGPKQYVQYPLEITHHIGLRLLCISFLLSMEGYVRLLVIREKAADRSGRK